jgi:hypothetical protein
MHGREMHPCAASDCLPTVPSPLPPIFLPAVLPCSVVINVLGKTERYELEEEFEFTSDRKRMSVVVRNLDSGEYVCTLCPYVSLFLPRSSFFAGVQRGTGL